MREPAFEFYRFRFHFRALDQIFFPPHKSANAFRGAFGTLLRETAPAGIYKRLFEPGKTLGNTPSGLADWPRPFVLRTAHLDGMSFPPGGAFFLEAHVFDCREPVLEHFRAALGRLADTGIGRGRGRALLEQVDQLDLEASAHTLGESPRPATRVSLEPVPGELAVSGVSLRFITPTELKAGGDVAQCPGFPILFARLRDRISTLRSLYGAGALDIDFCAMGQRASQIGIVNSRIQWEQVKRKSARTGQVHSIGGFTGEVEYEGGLGEFLPWLRAARWVGVGRQTVWGKGDVRVVGQVIR